MLAGLLSVLVAAPVALGAVAGIEPGQQLVYRGSVMQCVAGAGQAEPQ